MLTDVTPPRLAVACTRDYKKAALESISGISKRF